MAPTTVPGPSVFPVSYTSVSPKPVFTAILLSLYKRLHFSQSILIRYYTN